MHVLTTLRDVGDLSPVVIGWSGASFFPTMLYNICAEGVLPEVLAENQLHVLACTKDLPSRYAPATRGRRSRGPGNEGGNEHLLSCFLLPLLDKALRLLL